MSVNDGFFEIIQPDSIYQPASYNHAMRAGNTLYVAGQVARDESGQLVALGDAAAQAHQVFHNLDVVLRAAGARPEYVVKITTYLVDANDSVTVAKVRQTPTLVNTNRPTLALLSRRWAMPRCDLRSR